MRKTLIVLAFIFALIAVVFAVLPLGTLGVLPAGLSIVFGAAAYFKSAPGDKGVPKWLLVASIVILGVILAKSFVPDEVQKDSQFEQKKIESKQEDLKDLEELEVQ